MTNLNFLCLNFISPLNRMFVTLIFWKNKKYIFSKLHVYIFSQTKSNNFKLNFRYVLITYTLRSIILQPSD